MARRCAASSRGYPVSSVARKPLRHGYSPRRRILGSALQLMRMPGAKAAWGHTPQMIWGATRAPDMQGTGPVGVKPGTRGNHGALR